MPLINRCGGGIPDGYVLPTYTQSGKTITPTESVQTAVKANTFVTGDIKIAAVTGKNFTVGNTTSTGGTSLTIPMSAECEYLFVFRIDYSPMTVASDGNRHFVAMAYSKNADIPYENSSSAIQTAPMVLAYVYNNAYISTNGKSSGGDYLTYSKTNKTMTIKLSSQYVNFDADTTYMYMYM